jgi:hypothetical protein
MKLDREQLEDLRREIDFTAERAERLVDYLQVLGLVRRKPLTPSTDVGDVASVGPDATDIP